MTTEEKIKVMQAYIDGKQIQFKSARDADWEDLIIDQTPMEPTWTWGMYDYRVKPESKYAPYENTDEMIEDYCRRIGYINPVTQGSLPTIPTIWIINGGVKTSVISFGDNSVKLVDYEWGFNHWTMNGLFNFCTYLDGSPVGKLVEE